MAQSVFLQFYKVSRKKAGSTQQKHAFELRTEGQNTKIYCWKKAVEGKYSKQSLDDGKKIDEKVLQINICVLQHM